jgi:hypothetical protein
MDYGHRSGFVLCKEMLVNGDALVEDTAGCRMQSSLIL